MNKEELKKIRKEITELRRLRRIEINLIPYWKDRNEDRVKDIKLKIKEYDKQIHDKVILKNIMRNK